MGSVAKNTPFPGDAFETSFQGNKPPKSLSVLAKCRLPNRTLYMETMSLAARWNGLRELNFNIKTSHCAPKLKIWPRCHGELSKATSPRECWMLSIAHCPWHPPCSMVPHAAQPAALQASSYTISCCLCYFCYSCLHCFT